MVSKKLRDTFAYAFTILAVFLFVSVLPMVSYADNMPENEIVQSTGQTETEDSDIPADIELDEPEDIQPEDVQEGTHIELEEEQAETEATQPERLEPAESSNQYYISDDISGYEYETLMTLKSIEYQLKIIAGAVVLAVIVTFIWFTILNPIRPFARF